MAKDKGTVTNISNGKVSIQTGNGKGNVTNVSKGQVGIQAGNVSGSKITIR